MIIKNITLENFRSYYGKNNIDVGDGLTLIIGANGDGKTTLFDALDWLFDTAGKFPTADTKYISKKRSTELFSDETDYVRVSMTYENDNSSRIYEKSFRFSKTAQEDVIASAPTVRLYIQNGVENDSVEGSAAVAKFDRDFPPSIRKYCLFKGEQELNIFNKEEALSYLVETFSRVKDFDPYLSFMELAKNLSEKATDNAMKADSKNRKESERLRTLISTEEKYIGDKKTELEQCQSEAGKFKSLLESQLQNKESSELLANANKRLETLNSRRIELVSRIREKENYTFRLLDDMWILLGFEPVANEYKELVSRIDKFRRKEQSRYDQEMGAKKLAIKMQEELNNGCVPLALNVPDEKTMREMLDDEVCKVCGRPAPKGTPAYEFMKKRLEHYLASLSSHAEEDEDDSANPPLYKNDYVAELTSRYSVLHNNMKFLTGLNPFIEKEIQRNNQTHEDLRTLDANIEQIEEQKKKILAATDGLTEEQMLANYQDITTWIQQLNAAEKRSLHLDADIKKHQETLDGYRDDYSKIAEDSAAAMYSRTSTAIRRILDAFIAAKRKNRRDFLNSLELVANEYLRELNKGDFSGSIRIDEKAENSADVRLVDVDGTRIYNPNTALKTTMYMSLLFAVARLTTLKHENDYPLIFDAPTSSFTAAKESDFFGVIGNIKKQTIIVTKSFLTEGKDGTSVLDKNRLQTINGKQYRIELKKPFDEKDLSTIQTLVSVLN